MKQSDVDTLSGFARRQCEPEAPVPDAKALTALESFGRERLSDHFFMRDFLYSEIATVHGIPNIPSDPALALKAGAGLCKNLLEPLHEIFGHVAIRSAFRSLAVNAFGNKHGLNCASNKKNYAKHIWDHLDDDKCMGATACIVIPWFTDSAQYNRTGAWRPLAWFIHDHLPYSEMCFYPKLAAFNLTWRQRDPRREVRSYASPKKGLLTKPGCANHSGDHSAEYPHFPNAKSNWSTG